MKLINATRGAMMVCACTLICALAPATAVAATDTSTSFETTPLHLSTTTTATGHHTSSTSFGATMVRTFIGLAVVIAVIYGLTWVMRKTKAAGTGNTAVGTGLEQVASLPLGTNRAVSLVRVGDELHLLGVAEHGVSELRTYSEEEAYELGIPFNPEARTRAGGGAGPVVNRVIATVRAWTVR